MSIPKRVGILTDICTQVKQTRASILTGKKPDFFGQDDLLEEGSALKLPERPRDAYPENLL